MVPTSFVFLERMPLNPNGKVDRGALPAPGATRSFTPPRTQLEQTLANLWKQVLGIEKVGLEDNFFELGGNSIGLAQVHEKLRAAIHREVPITDLFQYPSVRTLADHLSPKSAQSPVKDDRTRARRASNRRADGTT